MNLKELSHITGLVESPYREVISAVSDWDKEEYDRLSDAGVTLTSTSSDAEQLEAYESLLGYLQPLYYPMFKDELSDLVNDFWVWMNNPTPYAENVKDLRNIPSGVKVWAIRWLQILNKSKHHDTTLSSRFHEELNRAWGNIDLSVYIDEAYNRIFSFTEKELVSFIRKFKELMKEDKGIDYALTPDQIAMFRPLFEKAQFLLAEIRTADCVSVFSPRYTPLKDKEEVVTLTEPLQDLLGTLFFEVDGSDLSDAVIEDKVSCHAKIDSLYNEADDDKLSDSAITEIGYYLHKLKKL